MKFVIGYVLFIKISFITSYHLHKHVLVGSTTYSENPDIYLTSPQIIARHGYPAESHIVQSEDGFLCTLHRIPYSKYSNTTIPGQPVFVHHGLLGSSADWILAGNKSLGFILSDAGYDVWLGNSRGNTYSRGHVRFSPSDAEFWDFSWSDMAKYDLPSALSYISNRTAKSGEIIYVGHSMGTSIFFAYSSMYKNASDIVKVMVALAPVAFTTDIKSPIKHLAPWANDLEWLAKHLGINEFLPNNKIVKFIARIACDENVAEKDICENLIFLFCGYDKEEFNQDILSAVLSHEPAGTSTKNIVHFAQQINSGGNFTEFDYGPAENMKRYGIKTPPYYNVTDINVPVYLISAQNDWLAGQKDVEKLAKLLPKKIGDFIVPLEKFNHIDFIYGIHAPHFVYKPLLKVIKQYESDNNELL